MKRSDLSHITIVFVFLLSIVAPGGVYLFSGSQSISSTEKRKLVEFPGLPRSISDIKIFPSQFEDYYRDHFGLRNVLTKIHNELKYYIGEPLRKGVIKGKEGWLFYGEEKFLEDYTKTDTFSPEQLVLWRQNLEWKHAWLKAQGIAYFFIVAPNKHTIYAEYLPEYIHKQVDRSRIDQLAEYVTTHNEVPFVDLRAVLLAAKSAARIYSKTDTHWNSVGANISQYEIISALSSATSTLIPQKLGDDAFTWKPTPGGDLANMLSMQDTLNELTPVSKMDSCYRVVSFDPSLYPKRTMKTQCPRGGPNVLVFRDSFASHLAEFLSNYFGDTTYLWIYPSQAEFIQYVRREKPHIVIEQRVERSLRLAPEAIDPALDGGRPAR